MSQFAPIKGTAQCYVSVHSKFHEYLCYHGPDKAGHTCKEDYITQDTCTNILRIHVNMRLNVESLHYLA